MKSALCDGKSTSGEREAIWEHLPPKKQISYLFSCSAPRPTCKRVRMTCPKCGRRLLSSVEYYHDGDYVIHTIPPHKPKGWWKHKNHKSKKNFRTERMNHVLQFRHSTTR